MVDRRYWKSKLSQSKKYIFGDFIYYAFHRCSRRRPYFICHCGSTNRQLICTHSFHQIAHWLVDLIPIGVVWKWRAFYGLNCASYSSIVEKRTEPISQIIIIITSLYWYTYSYVCFSACMRICMLLYSTVEHIFVYVFCVSERRANILTLYVVYSSLFHQQAFYDIPTYRSSVEWKVSESNMWVFAPKASIQTQCRFTPDWMCQHRVQSFCAHAKEQQNVCFTLFSLIMRWVLNVAPIQYSRKRHSW